MFTSPVRRARVSRQSVLRAVAGLALVALSFTAAATVKYLWNGAPYPPADPDAVAQRLKDRSETVYDRFALPGKYVAADSGSLDSGACYYRGLRALAHIDEPRTDVRSFGFSWNVPDVPEAAARDAQQRVRRQLERQDWKLTHEKNRAKGSFRELGFRYADPESGDLIDVDWNSSGTTLLVNVYAPCGQVSEEFGMHGW